MRIIFCVTNDISPDRRMHRICQSLQEHGHEVTLVGRKLPKSLPLPDFPFKTKRIKCWFNKGPRFYAEYNIRLFRYLKKQPADVIGAVDYDTLKAVTRACKSTGKKMVFDAHEWFEEVPELEGREKVKKYWMKIAREGLPAAKLRYTVSPSIALKMEELYGTPFDVIRNVPLLQGHEPSAIREDIILYLGVLNQGRGLEQMILAMKEIDAKLWLVGDGDIREELRALASRENLLDKVTFKGFVPHDELPPLLEKARIGINLLDGTSNSYRYSLANKFFDYVHAGLPQVCMDFPEYRRLNQEHHVATLLPDLNQFGLVYAINHFLDDNNYWFTYHATCLRARKDWCWQHEEKKLIALYSKLMR